MPTRRRTRARRATLRVAQSAASREGSAPSRSGRRRNVHAGRASARQPAPSGPRTRGHLRRAPASPIKRRAARASLASTPRRRKESQQERRAGLFALRPSSLSLLISKWTWRRADSFGATYLLRFSPFPPDWEDDARLLRKFLSLLQLRNTEAMVRGVGGPVFLPVILGLQGQVDVSLRASAFARTGFAKVWREVAPGET